MASWIDNFSLLPFSVRVLLIFSWVAGYWYFIWDTPIGHRLLVLLDWLLEATNTHEAPNPEEVNRWINSLNLRQRLVGKRLAMMNVKEAMPGDKTLEEHLKDLHNTHMPNPLLQKMRRVQKRIRRNDPTNTKQLPTGKEGLLYLLTFAPIASFLMIPITVVATLYLSSGLLLGVMFFLECWHGK